MITLYSYSYILRFSWSVYTFFDFPISTRTISFSRLFYPWLHRFLLVLYSLFFLSSKYTLLCYCVCKKKISFVKCFFFKVLFTFVSFRYPYTYKLYNFLTCILAFHLILFFILFVWYILLSLNFCHCVAIFFLCIKAL